MCTVRQGKLELALEEATKALEQNPRDAALAGNRADIYVQWREWLEAQPALKAAITLDPHNVLSHAGIAPDYSQRQRRRS